MGHDRSGPLCFVLFFLFCGGHFLTKRTGEEETGGLSQQGTERRRRTCEENQTKPDGKYLNDGRTER